MFEEAQKLVKLPTYVFALLDKLKAEERKKGTDLIDLTIGSPNIPPPPEVTKALIEALKDPNNSRYPSFEGNPDFRKAVVEWCQRQYGIKVDADDVVELIGSKEGIVHFMFAYLNPGDRVLVPFPAYPAHFRGPLLAGAEVFSLPTVEKNGFIPDLKSIDASIADKAKILVLSYPTNPTGATAPKEFFEEAVAFAKKHQLILLHDFAYAELYFDGRKPISCLSLPGAGEVCIEFHSLSKTFGMAGWRIGFAVGNPQLIESLRKMKTNLDYGVFPAVTQAAIKALTGKNSYLEEARRIYQKRRDIVVDGLNSLGWKIRKPQGAMYVWFPVPGGFDSLSFVNHLMQTAGIAVSPGTGFGELGEGYVRISLVDQDSRLTEAIARMKKAGIRYNG